MAACTTQHLAPRQVAVSLTPAPRRPSVSAEVLYDPGAPAVRLGPGEEYVPPGFTPGAPLPAYPAALVPMNLPAQTVSVRLLIGEDGKLLDVSPSPLATDAPDERYRAQFEASIRDVVGQWRFWPPRIRKFRPGPDSDNDGKPDYRIMVDELRLKAAFDIAFTFRIVDGRPVVTTESSSP